MLQRLYEWMMDKAAHAHAERWLFLFSFIESSFFPIPAHPLLGLICLARPDRAIRYGAICTLASVLAPASRGLPPAPVMARAATCTMRLSLGAWPAGRSE